MASAAKHSTRDQTPDSPAVDQQATTFSISDLAREFHITPRTIRFYEDQGLLSPMREGRTRVFTRRDRTRLKLKWRPCTKPRIPHFAERVRASFARQQAMALIGASMPVIEPGYTEIHLPHKPNITQQHGYIHGGVVGMIADSAAGYAASTLTGADTEVLTVEYKLNLLAPAEGSC
jgi:hypothetical protein